MKQRQLGSSHEEKKRSDQEFVSLLFTAQKGLQSHGRAAQTYPLVIKRGNGKSLMNKDLPLGVGWGVITFM